LPRYDAMYEAWDGKRVLADDAAKAATGVQKIVPVPSRGFGAFGKAVDEALAASKKLYLEGAASPAGRREEPRFDLETPSRADALASYAAAKKPDVEITSIARAIDAVRGVKSPYEIEMVRRAIRATGDGFVRAMRKARPGMWEFEFDAILQHAFVDAGATGLPYYPIVATGENACSMHYVANRTRFEDGDLVLCDAAAEWEWYASDITRTFPCNGKFTPAQRAAYEGVLRGQEAAAKALRPGTSLMELNRIAREAMEKAGLKQAYMHQYILGHQVGLNVHDAGGARFKPGMIITIEPGYYVKSEKFGIRIEDCYLVTEDGSECLSADIPKTVAEIEALVGADYR
ncbi:MAG TPA: M24 family metallopeptidase, partial [Planctomycetota bacterium]|nr:M24 family metallopeptidase [Planctomycetota bacterium]